MGARPEGPGGRGQRARRAPTSRNCTAVSPTPRRGDRTPRSSGATSRAGRDVAVAVTVFGECPGRGAVLRSGRAAGRRAPRDRAAWSRGRGAAPPSRGRVTERRTGRQAHRRPWPRLAEGMAARGADVHAMMDLSDGLGLDLHRLADASDVGFALDDLPVADGATLEEAISGGEDYELLIATHDVERLRMIFLDRRAARAPDHWPVSGRRSHVRTLRAKRSSAEASSTSSRRARRAELERDGLGDLARAQATGADVDALGCAVRPARARAGCSGSSDAWCDGASARRSCRTTASYRRFRRLMPW